MACGLLGSLLGGANDGKNLDQILTGEYTDRIEKSNSVYDFFGVHRWFASFLERPT
jgi:hypothetical protein